MIPEGYTVTLDGRVKKPSGDWQPLNRHPKGYIQFSATIDGIQRCYSVHRMACEQFHGPKPSPLHEVRHLNGDPGDNRPENLRWGTKAENIADRFRHGTVLSGEQMGTAVLTWEQVRKIRQRYTAKEGTTRSLASEYGVSAMTISKIVRNIFWVDPHYLPPNTDRKERALKAAQAPGSKLTWEAVREIRERYAAGGETNRSLGSEFGVTAPTINKIIRNVYWVDEEYTPPSR